MGFGSIAANILLFLGVIIIATTFVFYMNSYASQTTSAMNRQKTDMLDEMNADILITSSLLNESHSPDQIILYIKNTGYNRLVIDDTDIYVDGVRVSRTSTVLTVESDTDVGNPDLWDPEEILKLVAEYNVPSGVLPVSISTTYGANDQVLLSS